MSRPEQLAVVTGSTSGIGEALAAALVRRRWRVVGLARRASSFAHPEYIHLQTDLGDLSALSELIPATVGELMWAPGLTRLALVNNAADPGLLGRVAEVRPDELLRVYAVNVAAPVWLMGWIIREGPTQLPTRIVNVSSGAGVAPYPGLGTYGSAKAALRMAAMVLASELALPDGQDRDVTILSYSPGPVDTPMQAMARATPVERFPLLETFKGWAVEGQLMPPSIPAAEIVGYLEDDGYPRFFESRSGELKRPGSAS